MAFVVVGDARSRLHAAQSTGQRERTPVEHDDALPTQAAKDAPRHLDRRRVAVVDRDDRLVAAAQAALEGFGGIRRDVTPPSATPARSPGIGLFFEADAATHQPSDAEVQHPPAIAPGAGESEDQQPETTPSEVWNPFRRTGTQVVGGAPADRPAISHLHTRRNATDATVIASLEYGGRLSHGTAVGAPVGEGVLRAVAEATVAALSMLVGEPLPVEVVRVTLDSADEPATASVVLTRPTERGDGSLLGSAIVDADPERAVMQATLDALNRHLEPLLPSLR